LSQKSKIYKHLFSDDISTINKKNVSNYNMTYNEKKSLYESIIKDVAKTVKRQINEARISPYRDKSGLNYLGNADYANEDILDALDYIDAHDDMYMYYMNANIQTIKPTMKVTTVCSDGQCIYYNPTYIENLSTEEKAFLILHSCVHITKMHHANSIEDNIVLDKKVNRFLEEKWPEFRGMTKKLNGFI